MMRQNKYIVFKTMNFKFRQNNPQKYQDALRLGDINGNEKWYFFNKLELVQIDEHETLQISERIYMHAKYSLM